MTVYFSVVIPTYRRDELLLRCLSAVCAQTYDPVRYEVIIADDAASDVTRIRIALFAREHPLPQIRYIPVVGAHGPAAARNAGWRTARGTIIAFTDDDCIPDTRWLSAAASVIDDTVAGVSGRVVVLLGPEPTDYERNTAHLETSEFVTANCFYRRSALEDVGGFDECFTMAWREDADLYFTLLEQGYRLISTREAIVVHPVRTVPFARGAFEERKNMFNALLYKKHPVLYRQRIFDSIPGIYFVMVSVWCIAAGSLLFGNSRLGLFAGALWTLLVILFARRRLEDTSRAPIHVLEMLVTSALLPFLSLFWNTAGAIAFAAPFRSLIPARKPTQDVAEQYIVDDEKTL